MYIYYEHGLTEDGLKPWVVTDTVGLCRVTLYNFVDVSSALLHLAEVGHWCGDLHTLDVTAQPDGSISYDMVDKDGGFSSSIVHGAD